MVRKFTPWDRIDNLAALQALLEAGGATQVQVFAETATHPLTSPEDWWIMVLGGGCRGTIDQLDSAAKERVRQASLSFLEANEIHGLEADVLYVIARK